MTPRRDLALTAATLAVAGGGAFLAVLADLPAAALVGSTAVVAAVALVGAPLLIPAPLRDGAFTAIGCSLGAGVTPGIVQEMLRWPASLALLLLALAAMMAASTIILHRLFGLDRQTALLAASPGALSYTLALTAEGRGDARAVVVLQSIRLFSITLGLPLVLGLTAETSGARAAAATMPWTVAVGVFCAAYLLGRLGAARGVPAACLVSGMVLSAGLHVSGAVTGPPPGAFVTAGLCVTGAVIGSRFVGLAWRELARYAIAAAAVVLTSTGIAAAMALGAAQMLDIPFGQAWVTYAPGGVEAMAAMALALGYDPAFVAVHHVLRIVILIAVLPVLLTRLRREA